MAGATVDILTDGPIYLAHCECVFKLVDSCYVVIVFSLAFPVVESNTVADSSEPLHISLTNLTVKT